MSTRKYINITSAEVLAELNIDRSKDEQFYHKTFDIIRKYIKKARQDGFKHGLCTAADSLEAVSDKIDLQIETIERLIDEVDGSINGSNEL